MQETAAALTLQGPARIYGNPEQAPGNYEGVALPASVPGAFSPLVPDDDGPASPEEAIRLARVRLRLHAWASAPPVRDPPPAPVAGEFEI